MDHPHQYPSSYRQDWEDHIRVPVDQATTDDENDTASVLADLAFFISKDEQLKEYQMQQQQQQYLLMMQQQQQFQQQQQYFHSPHQFSPQHFYPLPSQSSVPYSLPSSSLLQPHSHLLPQPISPSHSSQTVQDLSDDGSDQTRRVSILDLIHPSSGSSAPPPIHLSSPDHQRPNNLSEFTSPNFHSGPSSLKTDQRSSNGDDNEHAKFSSRSSANSPPMTMGSVVEEVPSSGSLRLPTLFPPSGNTSSNGHQSFFGHEQHGFHHNPHPHFQGHSRDHPNGSLLHPSSSSPPHSSPSPSSSSFNPLDRFSMNNPQDINWSAQPSFGHKTPDEINLSSPPPFANGSSSSSPSSSLKNSTSDVRLPSFETNNVLNPSGTVNAADLDIRSSTHSVHSDHSSLSASSGNVIFPTSSGL
eukprot:TRINITY_DN7718_c0_g1_i1.p1 TRINITY_DN7718_c0_g1~~TRINITY_DN7718_c0_g1_i1.p1  ORF type:complete len:474 (+),score=190.59 TRINITY_DN7718_c0_g1_i1:186-1424(+)